MHKNANKKDIFTSLKSKARVSENKKIKKRKIKLKALKIKFYFPKEKKDAPRFIMASKK